MKYIIGNWKMNGNMADKESLFRAIHRTKTNNNVIICLPFTLFCGKNYDITIGAQDVSQYGNGAYTGDVSAQMLHDAGVKYVIVGHSERRLNHNENNNIVKTKSEQAIKNGITPIICIGETMAEKRAGKTAAVIKKMLLESAPKSGKYIIAYEPRWAIGSGKTPTKSEIKTAVKIIADTLPRKMPIVYGGSVNQDNARDIVSIPNVSGLLIGGASLKSETFIPIIQSIN